MISPAVLILTFDPDFSKVHLVQMLNIDGKFHENQT